MLPPTLLITRPSISIEPGPTYRECHLFVVDPRFLVVVNPAGIISPTVILLEVVAPLAITESRVSVSVYDVMYPGVFVN